MMCEAQNNFVGQKELLKYLMLSLCNDTVSGNNTCFCLLLAIVDGSVIYLLFIYVNVNIPYANQMLL